MQNNLFYYLGFSHFLGIGPMRFTALVSYFGTAKRAYQAKEKELSEVVGTNCARKFVEFRANFDPVKKLEELRQKEITVLTQEDDFYPPQLKSISDPPICLYVKGNLTNFNFAKDFFFAIVGTRVPTAYGEHVARKFAYELAKAGFVVVSGMAYGIDAIAHFQALQTKGKTVAFLGCGVDVVYPSGNSALYSNIIKQGSLVISEFPPGATVMKGLFIARNRLISGLSRGVLVVEGAKDSGSLITARFAAAQGKEVFAPPAPLTSYLSEAPNMLIKQGAKLVTRVEDILEEFNLKIYPNKKEQILSMLDEEEKVIFQALLKEPMISDELVEISSYPISKVLNILSSLEIKGVVAKNSEGKYEVINY